MSGQSLRPPKDETLLFYDNRDDSLAKNVHLAIKKIATWPLYKPHV